MVLQLLLRYIECIDKDELSNIVEFEIIPMLEEYWFDEPSKINVWSEKLGIL
ncbi:hypothetical protein ACVNP0_05175 [Staphylococcus aureus]